MIGIGFMFGRTTDLNHFQTIGTLEHLMPDVRGWTQSPEFMTNEEP